ncbi:hypothetical protein HYPSUDRAFT_85600 [Hypholoma sublateritium FD-334 SS-4]|uniref:SnoaL-like domain-containing protein n=1 Tax=Hypholoma sublateritium (strain FD-334 SS-4) TaxID=945553 RepID=A0A0D2P2G9_HYPSF|nr:hypothetical protein HYPSUDRAFT_85600 [Hypholoma sublateritium FD-334 SS-4]
MMEYTSHFSSKIQRLISFGLLLVAAFTTLTVAAPVDTSVHDTSALYRRVRQCPSIETIQQHIRPNVSPAHTVFYTKSATHSDARSFAGNLQPQASFFGSVTTWETILDWIAECEPGPEQDRVIPRISIALAREAKGIAYLITSGPIRGDSIWMHYEFPALQRNAKITSVTQYDLNTGMYTVIWNAGSTPTLQEDDNV